MHQYICTFVMRSHSCNVKVYNSQLYSKYSELLKTRTEVYYIHVNNRALFHPDIQIMYQKNYY